MTDNSYRVSTRHAENYAWFTISVYIVGDNGTEQLVAQKAPCKSYRRASRWALRRINDHRKALQILTEASP